MSDSPIGAPDVVIRPDVAPTAEPAETARDGSAARRPGDPAPAPSPDGAPIFSTDPLE